MAAHNDHHDGLAQQRLALEAMSSQLTANLQTMIAEQDQRAREFNALVPAAMEEMEVTELSPQSSVELPPTHHTKQHPTPKPKASAHPPRPAQTQGRTAQEQGKDESSIGGVAITCIVIAIYLFIECCS